MTKTTITFAPTKFRDQWIIRSGIKYVGKIVYYKPKQYRIMLNFEYSDRMLEMSLPNYESAETFVIENVDKLHLL